MSPDPTPPPRTRPGRERILDAAFDVLRTRGIAQATTKEIARAGQCSEALLYKHFADKQQIFLAVLGERLPALSDPVELLGRNTVHANLVRMTEELLDFYAQAFPIAASIFGSSDLLATWRKDIRAAGGGPEAPLERVRSYLALEQEAGRLPMHTDASALADLLVGAAFQQGFLAAFDGVDAVPHGDALAARLVNATLSPSNPTGP